MGSAERPGALWGTRADEWSTLIEPLMRPFANLSSGPACMAIDRAGEEVAAEALRGAFAGSAAPTAHTGRKTTSVRRRHGIGRPAIVWAWQRRCFSRLHAE
ncbi:MAG: hypothetical protein KY443_03725 [Actinobacteria bacterium]|nr:hypothetical protein [Actinomycetota bacterium]